MVFAHGLGEEVRLGGKSADVDVHDAFRELFIVQVAIAVRIVFVEQGADFIVLKNASELIETFFELVKLNSPIVIQVEIG